MSLTRKEDNILYFDANLTSENVKHKLTFAIDFSNCNDEMTREIAAREIRTRALDKLRINRNDKEHIITEKRNNLKNAIDSMNTDKCISINAQAFYARHARITRKSLTEEVQSMSIEALQSALTAEQLNALLALAKKASK